MKIDYPFKITTHNNIVLVDLPKTPEKYVEIGSIFTASNGVEIRSVHIQDIHVNIGGNIILFIRGCNDNEESFSLCTHRPSKKDAECTKDKFQTALDEFVTWMNKQEEPVTRLDVFKELFPDARTDKDGTPWLHCCDILGSTSSVCREWTCPDCRKEFWSQPAPEKFQKKEDK